MVVSVGTAWREKKSREEEGEDGHHAGFHDRKAGIRGGEKQKKREITKKRTKKTKIRSIFMSQDNELPHPSIHPSIHSSVFTTPTPL